MCTYVCPHHPEEKPRKKQRKPPAPEVADTAGTNADVEKLEKLANGPSAGTLCNSIWSVTPLSMLPFVRLDRVPVVGKTTALVCCEKRPVGSLVVLDGAGSEINIRRASSRSCPAATSPIRNLR
jgi:hypothetical protein